jgi:microsomal dipeptidase-like Zn-dependent dipeptidase
MKHPEAATIHDVVDHIMHIVEVAGWEHVGVGSDFSGTPSTPIGLEVSAASDHQNGAGILTIIGCFKISGSRRFVDRAWSHRRADTHVCRREPPSRMEQHRETRKGDPSSGYRTQRSSLGRPY